MIRIIIVTIFVGVSFVIFLNQYLIIKDRELVIKNLKQNEISLSNENSSLSSNIFNFKEDLRNICTSNNSAKKAIYNKLGLVEGIGGLTTLEKYQEYSSILNNLKNIESFCKKNGFDNFTT